VQNCRVISLPLFATLMYSESGPEKVSAEVGISMFTVPFAARCWQSRHQQIRTTAGSAVTLKVTAPHKHCPVLWVILAISLRLNLTRRLAAAGCAKLLVCVHGVGVHNDCNTALRRMRIGPGALDTRYPEFTSRLVVHEIAADAASFHSGQLQPLVVDSSPSLRECDPANPGRCAIDQSGFALDVHKPAFAAARQLIGFHGIPV
jgi:hypothetical protein